MSANKKNKVDVPVEATNQKIQNNKPHLQNKASQGNSKLNGDTL